jgi:hypothetical protein
MFSTESGQSVIRGFVRRLHIAGVSASGLDTRIRTMKMTGLIPEISNSRIGTDLERVT